MHFSRAHQSNLSRCKVVKVYDNVKKRRIFYCGWRILYSLYNGFRGMSFIDTPLGFQKHKLY